MTLAQACYIGEPFYVCTTCIDWFKIDESMTLYTEPGKGCEYCDDLTGRPLYKVDTQAEVIAV